MVTVAKHYHICPPSCGSMSFSADVTSSKIISFHNQSSALSVFIIPLITMLTTVALTVWGVLCLREKCEVGDTGSAEEVTEITEVHSEVYTIHQGFHPHHIQVRCTKCYSSLGGLTSLTNNMHASFCFTLFESTYSCVFYSYKPVQLTLLFLQETTGIQVMIT